MKDQFTILIADRNSHVRKFLQREMTAAGYRVRLAENAGEVLKCAFRHEPLDLVILDPDLPGAEDNRRDRTWATTTIRLPSCAEGAVAYIMGAYPKELEIGRSAIRRDR